jgi:hypothetical protein
MLTKGFFKQNQELTELGDRAVTELFVSIVEVRCAELMVCADR